MYITDKQNKGLFVFDTLFTIIWITLSGSPDTGPVKESIENALYSMYIYLLMFTKSLRLHVKHFIALTKRESVRRFFCCNYRSGYPCQRIDQWPRKTRESTIALATKKNKSMCKSNSYLTYGQSCKTWNYT